MRVHPHPKRSTWWDYCQDAECPKEHFIFIPFVGVRPATDKWEGVKHK